MDNWTKMKALFYLVEHGSEEEIEVKDFIREGSWDRSKLCAVMDESTADHIINNCSHVLQKGANMA